MLNDTTLPNNQINPTSRFAGNLVTNKRPKKGFLAYCVFLLPVRQTIILNNTSKLVTLLRIVAASSSTLVVSSALAQCLTIN